MTDLGDGYISHEGNTGHERTDDNLLALKPKPPDRAARSSLFECFTTWSAVEIVPPSASLDSLRDTLGVQVKLGDGCRVSERFNEGAHSEQQ